MTNFERIKNMNIDEMANFLAEEIPHGDCYGCGLCGLSGSCEGSWLEYLKSDISAFDSELWDEGDELEDIQC